MTASENQLSLTGAGSEIRRILKREILVLSILLVLWAGVGTSLARPSTPETNRPQRVQNAGSLDQVLDNLTGSALNHEGLDHSNLAIDQILQKSNKLIRKADRQRNKEINGKNPHSPLSQVLGQAMLALTDSNSYLLKLKNLQNALIAAQASTDSPNVDTHETCKDLNVEFKAVRTGLGNLKLSIKQLPLQQKAIADVVLWETMSRLNSAIHRVRLRTLQVGAALKLESELDLEAR